MNVNIIRRYPQLVFMDQKSLQLWLAQKTLDPTCAHCYQYISITPVLMTVYGYHICGRCSNSEQYKNIKTARSLANILMETKSFKCNNHYEGCGELDLNIKDVEEHEKKCIAKNHHECKFCSYDGTVLQLLHHSLSRHIESVSMDGVIFITVNKKIPKQSKLMVIEGNIFYADWELTEKVFTMQFKLLNEPNTRHYRLHFSTLVGQVLPPIIHNQYGLLRLQCDSYFEQSRLQLADLFGDGASIQCKISIEEIQLERRVNEMLIREEATKPDEVLVKAKEADLGLEINSIINTCNGIATLIKPLIERIFTCSRCKRTVPRTTYFCPNFHGCCLDCVNGYCQTCCRVTSYKIITYLEEFKLKCDWPSCGKIVHLYNYLSHKRACRHRPYKCPLKDCQETRLSSAALVKHWHFKMPHLVQNQIICFNSRLQDSEYLVWLYNHDLYGLSVYFNPKSVTIVIEEIDVVSNNNFEHLNCRVQLGLEFTMVPITRLGRRCEAIYEFNNALSDEESEEMSPTVIIRMDHNTDTTS